MPRIAEALDRKTLALIEDTVREFMAPFGLEDVTVRVEEDHTGEPSIFVEAHYPLSKAPLDMKEFSKASFKLMTMLPERLWAQGEARFPYQRHVFDEHQVVINP